jgi:hypothetical protein
MRAVTSVLSLSVLVPLASLSAQVQPSVEPGARVRVTQECREVYTRSGTGRGEVCPKHTGTFERVVADSIVLALDESGTRLAVPVDSVTRFDVSARRQSHPWRGAGIGFVAGAATGAVAGVITCGDGGCTEWGTGAVVVVGAAVFSAAGAVIGGVVGAFVKTDRWEEVPLDQLRVSVVPQRDNRFALALSVSF